MFQLRINSLYVGVAVFAAPQDWLWVALLFGFGRFSIVF
jgi:hypothetical protein